MLETYLPSPVTTRRLRMGRPLITSTLLPTGSIFKDTDQSLLRTC